MNKQNKTPLVATKQQEESALIVLSSILLGCLWLIVVLILNK